MAARALTDLEIASLIKGFIDAHHNLNRTVRQTGFSYNAVDKYTRKWRAGQLADMPGVPAYDPPSSVVRTQLDDGDGTAPAAAESRRGVQNLRRERDLLLEELTTLKHQAELSRMIGKATMQIPDWVQKRPSKKSRVAIPTAFLSDLHLDEVVRPEQVNFVNDYNREIAENRLRLFFDHVNTLSREYLYGIKYDGLVLPLGGDLFSGIIHEELVETNAGTIFESLLYWAEPMAAGIRHMADVFGRVFLPCVVGNHGRRQRKPHAKNRPQDNFDWFFAHLLAKLLGGDKRLTFAISPAADQPYTVYSTRYLLTHGDQFRGGSGIAGMLSPLLLGDARKRERENAVKRPYDYLIMGHWHQLAFLRGLIINGCFPANQKVATSNGMRDIIDIKKGDFVMSRDGSKQQVTHTFTKEASRLIGIKIAGLPEVLTATPNHLIWARKKASGAGRVTPQRRHFVDQPYGPAQWIPIDFLSPGDYVHVPFPIGNDRPIDTETAWAYGLFLAEGSALLDGGASKNHHRINLTMHIKEIDILRRWAKWFEQSYGRVPRITTRPQRNTSDLVVTVPRETAEWFQVTFGHRAKNKHVPDGAMFWADDLKQALVSGWITGDGCVSQQLDCRPTISATTISHRLAWEMFHMGRAMDRIPALSKLTAGGKRKNDAYTVHFNIGQHSIQVDQECFFEVIERYERNTNETVYDLEVSGEHTYSVEGVGVHNSLKGYDEYAYISNFRYEPPRQAFWLTDPDHGVTITAPIHVTGANEQYTSASGPQAVVVMGRTK